MSMKKFKDKKNRLRRHRRAFFEKRKVYSQKVKNHPSRVILIFFWNTPT